MKKYSVAVCVCAVLFSVGIHGGGMREVSARAPGADENLAILQDIIRENECQAGMAFLGYTYEGAEAAEILEYTRQGEVAAAYPFLSTAGGAAGRILTAALRCTTLRLPLCRPRRNPACSPSGNPVSG